MPVILLSFMQWYKRPANFPPGPRGIPLLGAIPFMGKYPERVVKKWTKSYGQVMSVRFGTWEMVVLNDYDSVHQVIEHFIKVQLKFFCNSKFQSNFILNNKMFNMVLVLI